MVLLQAGTTDVLIDHLPGCPDGISRSSDGGFWISLVAQVPPYARFLQPPGTRAVIAWVTHFVKLPIKFWGAVLKVSAAVFGSCMAARVHSCCQSSPQQH